MIYRFQSKASGDVLMNGPIGDRMLEIVGRSPAERGIVEAAALPAAIAAIERAIAAERDPATAGGDGAHGNGNGNGDAPEPEKRVGLGQRAYPLLQLMKRSVAQRADVVWGV